MSYPKLFQTLKDHMDERFDKLEAMIKPDTYSPPKPPDVYSLPIFELDLPTQQESALIAAGYKTIGDLDAQTDETLMDVSSVGKRTVEFIRQKTRELSTGAW